MASNQYKRSDNLQVSANFKQNEFDCKGKTCGCKTTLLDTKLIRKLQVLRMVLGRPLSINSGYRCARHNKAVGGASGSYHVKGRAADIRCSGISPEELAKAAQRVGFSGIGCYTGAGGNFVHVDVRQNGYFWKNDGSGNKTSSGFGAKHEICPYQLGNRTLSVGSRGEDVKALQWMLSRCSIVCTVDGIFGNKTKGALEEFQDAVLLKKDGVFGKNSRNALREALE